METLETLGWDPETVGEMDHRRLKAPHVKLRSITTGEHGDRIYCIDLRISMPNVEFVPMTGLHSMEHFLLAGFRKVLGDHFLSVGIMGCQTGFYLVLLNEGQALKICDIYQRILEDILKADKVPYESIQECGNFKNHDLKTAQGIARRILDGRSSWLQII